MSQTAVSTSSSISIKQFSVALFAYIQRSNNLGNILTGPAPKQAEAEAKLKGQTSADMPVVRVTDLSKAPGDNVSMDLFNVIGGKPIMGDQNRNGRGDKLSWSSMTAKVDKLSKVVDAGGEMSQQRTRHKLRGIAMAALAGYFPRLEAQQILVHLAGARGSQGTSGSLDWIVPSQTDVDFASIMVNTVQAPTYNRHYVKAAGALSNGGVNLGSVVSTDTPTLDDIDEMRRLIDNMEFPLQPIKIADDPAKDDEPLYLWLMPPSAYSALLRAAQTSGGIRDFHAKAWERKGYGSKHPLFMGEVGIWNGMLVKKISRSIRFAPSESTNIITSANAATATESAQAVNASLAAGYVVERTLLVGAQALANVYGRNQGSDWYTQFKENLYNFEDNYEAVGQVMNGKAKVRLNVPDTTGTPTPTDIGVFAVDFAAKS